MLVAQVVYNPHLYLHPCLTGIHTYTDLRGAPDRVQRSVKYAVGRGGQ